MPRRRLLPVTAAVSIIALGLATTAAASTTNTPLLRTPLSVPAGASATGRTLVSFPPGVNGVRRLRDAGATQVEEVQPGVAVGRLAGAMPRDALRAEPELIRNYDTSSDPLASKQWALTVQHADAAAARADGTGVTVAVLDSGVDGTHADLAGQVLAGGDATAGVEPLPAFPAGSDSDVYGHGTAVSGVIAALRNNGIGIAGMAPGAKIIPVRVGDQNGISSSAFIRGMRFAITSGAKIINLSFGGCGSSPLEQQVIDDAAAAGILVVASAGNRVPGLPTSCVYPAAYNNVIAVGATTNADTQAPYSMAGQFVDLSAPGGTGDGLIQDDIVTTWMPEPAQGCPFNCYTTVAGTSFSAPYAVGVMALVWSADPSLAPSRVVGIVAGTSIDLGAPGVDTAFGAGRVDAGGAVALAKGARTPTRFAGADRYSTAVDLSQGAFPEGSSVAYLARGDVFSPDALAAGPAAIVNGAPVLLVAQCSLPATTAAELVRLGATEVVVLGGPAAVCDQVVGAVGGIDTHPGVRRIQGADRFATAGAIATDTFPSGAGTAYLARADVFSPDALVGGTVAGLAHAPLLLTDQCDIPASTQAALDALHVVDVIVLGGSSAVCDGVLSSLLSGGRFANRIDGVDRYATSVAIATAAFPGGASGAVIARGDVFSPDGLVAAPFAALSGRPLLITPQCSAPPTVARYLDDLDATTLAITGGPDAVCDAVLPRYL